MSDETKGKARTNDLIVIILGIAAVVAFFVYLTDEAKGANDALSAINQTDGVTLEIHARPAADGVVYTVTRKP